LSLLLLPKEKHGVWNKILHSRVDFKIFTVDNPWPYVRVDFILQSGTLDLVSDADVFSAAAEVAGFPHLKGAQAPGFLHKSDLFG
jgi:hypothetical protein